MRTGERSSGGQALIISARLPANLSLIRFPGPQPDFRTRLGKFRAPKARAAKGVWGHAPPEMFEIQRLRNGILTNKIFLGIISSIKRFLKKKKKKSQNQDEAIASSCLMLATTLFSIFPQVEKCTSRNSNDEGACIQASLVLFSSNADLGCRTLTNHFRSLKQ